MSVQDANATIRDDAVLDLVVTRRTLSGAIAMIEITARDGRALPRFSAGAHVDVHLAGGIMRQYSLCNDPEDAGRYMLGVLLDPGSRGGSAAVHADLTEGASVRIGSPRNNFMLEEGAEHSILLGGGIGITPLLAMAWRLHALGRDFELHYCARSADAAGFRDHLLATPFAGSVFVHLDDGDQAQRLDIGRVLSTPSANAHVYICGPTGFMDFVVARAEAFGWPNDNLHLERFTADVDTSGVCFTVRAARSGLDVQVPEGRSIADMLIEAGVDVPLSCEQGICGTCMTRVIEGIPDHRDLYQMDDEKAANDYITICCSRAKTPLLVLDL